jgi:hypothetical protein
MNGVGLFSFLFFSARMDVITKPQERMKRMMKTKEDV